MSKVITVLGGNGYIGSRCISTLLQNVKDIKIYSISRRGENKYIQNKFDSRVEIIKGDCLSPSDMTSVIKASSGVIHSIGVLITTNNNKYQLLNKETCLRVADLAEAKENSKTNFVYVSAMRGLPFPLSIKFHGYIDSKRECEKRLLSAYKNINPVILRPGFVKSNEKLWTVPLYYGVNLAAMSEKLILSKILPNIGDQLQLPSKGIELDTLANFACAGALGLLKPFEIYDNDFMNKPENKTKLI